MPQYRVELDADVTFTNGGDLRVRGFRLDAPGPDVDEQEAATLLLRSLGLLMAGPVTVHALRVIEEPHKGTRGGPSAAPGGTGPSAAAPSGRRLVDLSHPIVAGMTTYPGLPGPEITPHLTREASRAHYAEGTEFAIDRISMVGNTGTYLDSPFHRYADGDDLAALPLEALADLPAVVVRVTGSAERGIDVASLAPFEVRGAAVLLHTGWDAHWGTPAYGGPAPYLTGEAARWLVDEGAALVGIDSVNIDDTTGDERPAHSTLLAARIPIVEHLTGLEQVPVTGARFTAAPPRVASFGTFPVRAFAVVPEAHPAG
ncbi:MAG TPA: cyclase family protein [Egibacteraceae bacterium]